MRPTKTVDEWNRAHPVGTPVRYHPALPEGTCIPLESATRSSAWSLASGTGVILIQGIVGCVALTHLDVADVPVAEDVQELLQEAARILRRLEGSGIAADLYIEVDRWLALASPLVDTEAGT